MEGIDDSYMESINEDEIVRRELRRVRYENMENPYEIVYRIRSNNPKVMNVIYYDPIEHALVSLLGFMVGYKSSVMEEYERSMCTQSAPYSANTVPPRYEDRKIVDIVLDMGEKDREINTMIADGKLMTLGVSVEKKVIGEGKNKVSKTVLVAKNLGVSKVIKGRPINNARVVSIIDALEVVTDLYFDRKYGRRTLPKAYTTYLEDCEKVLAENDDVSKEKCINNKLYKYFVDRFKNNRKNSSKWNDGPELGM